MNSPVRSILLDGIKNKLTERSHQPHAGRAVRHALIQLQIVVLEDKLCIPNTIHDKGGAELAARKEERER